MIVQPREPNPGSALEHVCSAKARHLEPWVTDEALYVDQHGRVRINYELADRLRAEREPNIGRLIAEREGRRR